MYEVEGAVRCLRDGRFRHEVQMHAKLSSEGFRLTPFAARPTV
jgi:hypothetical protein